MSLRGLGTQRPRNAKGDSLTKYSSTSLLNDNWITFEVICQAEQSSSTEHLYEHNSNIHIEPTVTNLLYKYVHRQLI